VKFTELHNIFAIFSFIGSDECGLPASEDLSSRKKAYCKILSNTPWISGGFCIPELLSQAQPLSF